MVQGPIVMLHARHVTVPNVHTLSFTELDKSHTELLARIYICVHGQVCFCNPLLAMVLERHHS